MPKRRRPPRRLSCVRKISGASRYNFKTKRRLRIKVKRKYQSGNRNDEDVPREPPRRTRDEGNKRKRRERKKGNKGGRKRKKNYPLSEDEKGKLFMPFTKN